MNPNWNLLTIHDGVQVVRNTNEVVGLACALGGISLVTLGEDFDLVVLVFF